MCVLASWLHLVVLLFAAWVAAAPACLISIIIYIIIIAILLSLGLRHYDCVGGNVRGNEFFWNAYWTIMNGA